VLSTFTGLRLEWRSPPRDASTVSWRDAFARLGLFCTPLLLLALWVFSSEELAAPHLAPLWLPLLVAVPLAVLTSHEKFGMALRRLRMLLVPDEVRTPATLANAIARRGFADLMPMPEPVVAVPVAPVVRSPARAKPRIAPPRMLMPWSTRAGPVFASIAIFMITTFTPPFAQTPALPSDVRQQIDLQAALANQADQLEQAQFFVASGEEVKRPRARARPARMIDDEVRQRAREAVRRSLSGEELDAAINGQVFT
jgi:membrane glycosyltransferase